MHRANFEHVFGAVHLLNMMWSDDPVKREVATNQLIFACGWTIQQFEARVRQAIRAGETFYVDRTRN